MRFLLVSLLLLCAAAPPVAHAQQGSSPADQLSIPAPPATYDGAEASPDVRYPVPSPGRVPVTARDDSTDVRIPSRIITRIRALDASLQALAARSGSHIVNAILSLVTGGVTITLGALNSDNFPAYLYVYGGVSALRGILELTLTPNPRGPAIRFSVMPMRTPEEVRDRLRFGERTLSQLAKRALTSRVLDGSLNLAVGLAVIPVHLAPKSFNVDNTLDYFVLIGAGVAVISGIVTLASTSAAEQRWSAYVELRERLRREREEERESRAERGDVVRDDLEDELSLDFLELTRPEGPRLAWRGTSLAVTF
ncbi:MAG: hypothetical protein ACFCGT_15125 [Sandaracinaceae bacterium]